MSGISGKIDPWALLAAAGVFRGWWLRATADGTITTKEAIQGLKLLLRAMGLNDNVIEVGDGKQ
jgi:hypothetical protein